MGLMTKHIAAALVCAAVASVLTASAQHRTQTTGVAPAVQTVLEEIRQADKGQLAVSEEDGRFLRLMVASSGAKQALEIGAASGYSAIWIGLGLRETGGKLTTIEYDPQRAREAKANIQSRGPRGHRHRREPVTRSRKSPRCRGTFDFVFLDAWKPDYKRFLRAGLPASDPGGLFLAHNVVNKRDEMEDFLGAIESNADLFTTIVAPSGEGMSVSWKRR